MKNIFFLLLLLVTNVSIAQTGTSKFKYVSLNAIPKPKAPANLIITDVSFNDDGGNKNKILDAEEKAEIRFTIENKGQGDAYAIIAQIEDGKKVKGFMYVYLLKVDKEIEPDFENAIDGEEHTEWGYFTIDNIHSETTGEYMYKLDEIILLL